MAEGDVRGLRVAWSRDVGGLPVDPAVTSVLEAQRATLEGLGCVVEDAEPDFSGADECFEVLRAVTFAGAFKEILHQVKPTLAENVRFGLSLTPERIARAYAHRGAMFARMREFLLRYDVVRRAGHPGAGVRRRRSSSRRRSPACDGDLPLVVPLLLADHAHVASGGRGPGRVHAGRAAGRAAARGPGARRGGAAAGGAGVPRGDGARGRRPEL